MSGPLHFKQLFFFSFLVAFISIGGLIALLVVWHKKLTPFQDYALVVDAGSTHSKIFVYTWPADKSDGLGLTSRVNQIKSCDVENGPITSIVNPTQTNVQQYFNSAMSDCIKEIPSTRKNRALIYLGGTAGLRLFQIGNSSYTNDLLNGTRAYFSTLGLLFKSPESQVRIISGTEEGLSGWISSNLLLGQLYKNNKPFETYGVTEMGGASTQMSFISPTATFDRFSLNLFNTEYDTYSHSYLCYGTEQLRNIYLGQLVNKENGSTSLFDPCLQRGFIQNLTYNRIFGTPCARNEYAPLPYLNTSSIYSFLGTGDYTGCAAAVRERLNTANCTSTTCSFDNVYQPKPISPDLKFIAISAWYLTFRTLAPNISLSPNPDGNYELKTVNLSQIKTALNLICSQLWSTVPNPDQYRPFLCFNSMYHWTLFEYGYSMTNENLKNFQIIKAINSNEIGWTLGYMINQTNYLDPENRPKRLLTKAEFIGLLCLCAFLLVSAILAIISLKCYKQH